MKSVSKKQLRRKLLCALVAGALTAPFAAQTAYALPIEGANAAANAEEANISKSGAVMNIMGKTDHNILRWEDFSIDSGEKVRFDGGNQERDYLNLVTGEGASNIYGTIEGGRNVYLVNPHGILFAQGSQVNTGALYLSTANPADIATATNAFKANGTSPLSATAQTGDVLNLGTVKASKLYIEGKNVKVLNTDAVTDTNGTALTGANVTIRSEDAPHIGYDVANTTTRNFTVDGATVTKNVSDYKNANNSKSATSRGWVVQNLSGTAHTEYDYMRVHNVYELQHMDANRVNAAVTGSDKKIIGRYMLANDIAASETKDWDGGFQPIGSSDNSMGAFTGRFDGVGHTITGLTIKPPTDSFGEYSRGMFAYINHGAVIENVSLKDASVSGAESVGGIVGDANYRSIIRNVSFSGKVHGNSVVGGIVGELKQNGSIIENAYHEGTVEGNRVVGGIVGYAAFSSTVQNVRNAGKVLGNEMLGGIAGSVEANSRVQNAVQMGTVEQRTGQTDSQVGGVVGLLSGATVSHAVWKEGSVTDGNGALIRKGIGKEMGNPTETDVKERSLNDMKKAATYAEWGSDVATEGGKRTPWRIYDGKTMPLLTAFLRTKTLANRESVYDGMAPTIAGLAPGITWQAGKDVGTYHAYSEQYDIIGGAYTVKPKELTLNFTSGTRFDKTYDGGSDTATRTLTKGQHYNLGGFVGSDGADVELAGAVTGKYADKNAGRDKEVTFQNLALTGTGSKNYTIKKAQGVGTITPKQLTLDLVGSTRFDKTYDGNANVTQSLAKGTNYTLTGFVTGEGNGIALGSSAGTYSDKNAAADKTVTFDGLTLTGTGAGNYTLNKSTLTGIGTILRRALTLGAVASQSKTYDGNTLADTSKFHAALNNVVAGEENSVKATATGAAYNSKDVAAANRIDYTGVALAGTEAGNYTLAATTAQGAGTISRRALTVDTVAAQSKTYDGTTAADTSKFQATLGNLVAGEEGSVTATATGAAYNSKDVRAANTVGYTGLALTGTGAANYSLAATTAQGAGRITPKQLNLALAGGARFDKTYDGNANVTQSLTKGTNYTLTGFVGTEGDHLALASATGTYTAGKDARTDKEVTFKNLTLTGTGETNYTLNKTTLTGTGTIAQRTLTLGAVAGQTFDKVYDGTTNAGDALKKGENYTLSNFADGEGAGITVTSTGTGSYADKNVGTHAVTYTGLTLTGAGAGNYRLNTATLTGTGRITPRTLTLTAAPQSIVQGAPLPSFTGRAEGFADGEDERVFGADGITFGTTLTNTDTPGSYDIIGRVGSTSDGVVGNYRITQAAGNARAFNIAAPMAGGILAALVQDAAPRFDMGFGQEVYVFGLPRPIRALTLGFYRFDAERDLEIQGLRL